MIVRFTGTVIVEAVKLMLVGLKLHALSGGRLPHIDGVSVVEPVKPACAANVSIVDPDCPGLAMLTVHGFALIVNGGNAATTSTKLADEAAEVDPP